MPSSMDSGFTSLSNAPSSNIPVVLPCEPEQFGEFISSLLGKPQTLSKRFRGVFEIRHHDVENIYYLVDQRIQQQNKASLIQFTVKVIYNDDSSVTLNSLEEFKVYNEVRSVYPTALILSWSYLVTFQDRKSPEKQQIDVSFWSNFGHQVLISEDEFQFISSKSQGAISFRINHTARTWGADIESLLTNHINNIIRSQSKFRKFLLNYNGTIGIIASLMFFLSVLVGGYIATDRFLEHQVEAASAISVYENGNLEAISQQLSYLAESIASGTWPRFTFNISIVIITSIILSVFFGVWIAVTAHNPEPSFILLTKKSEDRKKKVMKRFNRSWALFFTSLATGIATSIIGNILFVYFFQNWQP